MQQTGKMGRPRSEQARTAVLNAVDDLLLEVGYAAMTMKNIAERAGVGRQTVYRWWSNKAEILLEACAVDAEDELAVPATGDLAADACAFLDRLVVFLARSPAGAGYRALLGEAQHDPVVAELVASNDVVAAAARGVLTAAAVGDADLEQATAALVGPVVFWMLTGHDPAALDIARLVEAFVDARPAVTGGSR